MKTKMDLSDFDLKEFRNLGETDPIGFIDKFIEVVNRMSDEQINCENPSVEKKERTK